MEWRTERSKENYQNSVKKWEGIVHSLEDAVKGFDISCGHCAEFKHKGGKTVCGVCPLLENDLCKDSTYSYLFFIIKDQVRTALSQARTMLDAIVSSQSTFQIKEEKELTFAVGDMIRCSDGDYRVGIVPLNENEYKYQLLILSGTGICGADAIVLINDSNHISLAELKKVFNRDWYKVEEKK